MVGMIPIPDNGVIAVVVPVYNVAPYLKECLDSLLAQTYPHWKAFLVDDGSMDESGKIVDEYGTRDARFRVFHKLNGGISSARNFALEKIASDAQDFFAVTFLDGDDYLFEDAYSNLMHKMLSENADILFFGYKRSFPDRVTERDFNGIQGKVDRLTFFEAVFSYGDWRGKNGAWGVVWNKFFRTEVILDIRFIEDKEFNEDELFCLNAALKSKTFYFVSQSYYFYRQREGSLIRAIDFSVRLARGRLLGLQVLEESAIKESGMLQYRIKSAMLQSFLNAKKDNGAQFFKNFSFFAKVAEVVLSLAGELHRQGNISDIDYRLISAMASIHMLGKEWTPKKLIVSMTSYPARISGVSQALETIFNQTLQPDEIVLWLGKEKFPNQLSDLPKELQRLAKEGKIAIKWVHDLGPHTKYFYAFKAYPDALVITVDDDVLYPENMIEHLYQSYLLFPNAVSALRARLIFLSDDGEFSPFKDWFIINCTDKDSPLVSMQFLAEGVGGCLYPTDLFLDAVALLDVGIIQRTCPNNDDLWLKAMQLMLDIPVVAAGSGKNPDNVPDSQKLALWHYNLTEGGTDYEWRLILREMEKRYGKGIFINKLLKPSKGEDFLGRDNLHRLLIDERNYYEKTLQQLNRVYAKYITLRVDVCNRGEGNKIMEQSVVPNVSRIIRPSWLPNGVCIESRAGEMKVILRCLGNGELDIRLRGRDERNANRQRYPVWIDCTYFSVNGEVVFDEVKTICHDRPYLYRKPVKDGEVIELAFCWEACRSPTVLEENNRLRSELKMVEEKIKHFHVSVPKFRIGDYLKYKILTKLTFGGMRAHYREKYQQQKRIYRAIRRGRLDF